MMIHKTFRMVLLIAFIAFSICCAPQPGLSLEQATGMVQSKEASKSSHFYFVQITDTHLGDADHLERTKKIVESINRLPMKIEFVVHTGDITADRIDDPSTVAKGLSVLKKLKMPLYFVPGNHDILARKLDRTLKTYEKDFGGLISVQHYDGVDFIFVYTEPLAMGFSISGYHPLKELENRLRAADGRPVIIFHHRPCVDNFYLNEMHEGWRADIRKKWIDLINSYNVKAVIAGHFHMDELHWLGEIPLYVSSSVAGYWGRQATFRIYEYSRGKISYYTQYIE